MYDINLLDDYMKWSEGTREQDMKDDEDVEIELSELEDERKETGCDTVRAI